MCGIEFSTIFVLLYRLYKNIPISVPFNRYTNEMARQLLLSDVPATLLKLTVEDDRTVKVLIVDPPNHSFITEHFHCSSETRFIALHTHGHSDNYKF